MLDPADATRRIAAIFPQPRGCPCSVSVFASITFPLFGEFFEIRLAVERAAKRHQTRRAERLAQLTHTPEAQLRMVAYISCSVLEARIRSPFGQYDAPVMRFDDSGVAVEEIGPDQRSVRELNARQVCFRG